jgi:hypothetical protein
LTKRLLRSSSACAAAGLLTVLAVGHAVSADTTATAPAHTPHMMGAVGIQPPPVTLPVAVPGVAAGQPAPVNMAYFGGHVQVAPKIYLVFWGWGEPKAFTTTGHPAGFPKTDPDGAAARMTAFIKAIGGTPWAGVQTQYFQTDAKGNQQNITNPRNQFGGVWYDNTDPIHNNISGLNLAQEAARAVAHFKVTDLANSQFIIAQPQNYNEAGFNSGAGYCAWHDYTQKQFYPGVKEGISFTNMPYVLNLGGSCGENFVNSGQDGVLDGFTIVLGHEVEETVTDPGAEDVINGKNLGGWYDYDYYENGDKCAWVGDGIQQVPGAAGNITGNDGKSYPVQSLWSNQAAQGVGYCAGVNDLPF